MTDYFGGNKITPWSLAEIYADLGSRRDISRILNVTHFRVDWWLAHRTSVECPYPVRRLGHVDVYSMQEWKDWFARWLANHPRKDVQEAKPHGSGESFFSYFDD